MKNRAGVLTNPSCIPLEATPEGQMAKKMKKEKPMKKDDKKKPMPFGKKMKGKK